MDIFGAVILPTTVTYLQHGEETLTKPANWLQWINENICLSHSVTHTDRKTWINERFFLAQLKLVVSLCDYQAILILDHHFFLEITDK